MGEMIICLFCGKSRPAELVEHYDRGKMRCRICDPRRKNTKRYSRLERLVRVKEAHEAGEVGATPQQIAEEHKEYMDYLEAMGEPLPPCATCPAAVVFSCQDGFECREFSEYQNFGKWS